MKGKWIYLGISGFLGILCALEDGLIFLVVFFILVGLLVKYKRFSMKQMALISGVFIIFFIRGQVDQFTNISVLKGDEKFFEIRLDDYPKIDGNSFSSFVTENRSGEKITVQYTILTIEEKEVLQEIPIGTVCRVVGTLEKPVVPRNSNAFDFQEYLHYQGVFWKLKIERFTECQEINNPLILIQRIRQAGTQYINRNFLPETAPLAAALIFGERTSMEQDLIEAYQRLGIVHLLAISGLNVGMLVGILLYLGLRLQITREKMTNLLMAILPVYMILTGASPSVNRACIMMFFILLLTKLNQSKKMVPIDIIGIVFFLYIFLKPYVIYDVGFQLSFSVTFSLVLSTPILAKLTLRPISLLLATSFISQLASAPILLYYFYEFSLVSLLVNIPYVPLFSVVILPLMLFVLFLHFLLGDLIDPLVSLLESFVVLLNSITRYLSTFPYSTIILGRPSVILLILYCIFIPYFFHKWQKTQSRKGLFLYLLIPIGIMFFQYISEQKKLDGEVTMIDVGQGDSILIRLPLGKGTYLIDTGGTLQFQTEEWKEREDPFEVGKDVLVPYLKSKGISKIDKLILTHGDVDHMGGAFALLRSIKVKELVLTQVAEPSQLARDVMILSKDKKIPVHYAKKGDSWSVGEFQFKILAPPYLRDAEGGNNQSIVIYTELGGLTWLFTGDLEVEGEERLISGMNNFRVDVLKVGHHGSKTSTSELLLNSINPHIALISAGVDNRFGHPHADVLAKLKERNIKIYRTDQSGEISFKFRGNDGTFSVQVHTIYQKN